MLAKLEHIFLRTNQVLIGSMMGGMFILVFVNVVSRYIFGLSFATTEEISTFLMIWITYIGAGLALREGRLAAIDLFQDMIQPMSLPDMVGHQQQPTQPSLLHVLSEHKTSLSSL